jgi:hypothetical protein
MWHLQMQDPPPQSGREDSPFTLEYKEEKGTPSPPEEDFSKKKIHELRKWSEKH